MCFTKKHENHEFMVFTYQFDPLEFKYGVYLVLKSTFKGLKSTLKAVGLLKLLQK